MSWSSASKQGHTVTEPHHNWNVYCYFEKYVPTLARITLSYFASYNLTHTHTHPHTHQTIGSSVAKSCCAAGQVVHCSAAVVQPGPDTEGQPQLHTAPDLDIPTGDTTQGRGEGANSACEIWAHSNKCIAKSMQIYWFYAKAMRKGHSDSPVSLLCPVEQSWA